MYNPNYASISNALTSDANVFIGQDIAIYPASYVYIYVGATVQIANGLSTEGIRGDIVTALTEYISNLSMGATIDQAALIDLIMEVPGVVDIKIPLDALGKQATLTTTIVGSADIELGTNEYAVLGTTNIKTTYTKVSN